MLSLVAGNVRVVDRRNVIRSTIYSGSTVGYVVAIKPESKGRHHSISRQPAMKPLSGFVSGSSAGRHAHRAYAQQVARFLTDSSFGSLLISLPFPRNGGSLGDDYLVRRRCLEHRVKNTQQLSGHRHDGSLVTTAFLQPGKHGFPSWALVDHSPSCFDQGPSQ